MLKDTSLRIKVSHSPGQARKGWDIEEGDSDARVRNKHPLPRSPPWPMHSNAVMGSTEAVPNPAQPKSASVRLREANGNTPLKN